MPIYGWELEHCGALLRVFPDSAATCLVCGSTFVIDDREPAYSNGDT